MDCVSRVYFAKNMVNFVENMENVSSTFQFLEHKEMSNKRIMNCGE